MEVREYPPTLLMTKTAEEEKTSGTPVEVIKYNSCFLIAT